MGERWVRRLIGRAQAQPRLKGSASGSSGKHTSYAGDSKERRRLSRWLEHLVMPRQEEHDSRDHDVCKNVCYPGSEHAARASPNDSHEQPVHTSQANPEPAARKPSNMD